MTYSFIGLADTIPKLPNPNYTKHGNIARQKSYSNLKVFINDNNKDINHKGASHERKDTK